MSETLYYIICVLLSVAVLTGISFMSKVKTAVAGNLISAVSVLLGIIITLIYKDIFSAWTVYIFMLIGVLIGSALALRVKMIQMPQLVALLNGVGGLASALVGTLSLLGIGNLINEYPVFVSVTSVLAIVVGLVTLFGSLVAAGKLHKLLPQKPVVWKNHSTVVTSFVVILICTIIYSAFTSNTSIVLFVSIVISSLFGYAFAIRVGGADMPITISLLNSLSGVAGAIAGMAVNDLMLVSVGGIVGASGLFLTQIMCKAMNRSLSDILLGKTSVDKSRTKADIQFVEESTVVETAEEEVHETEDNLLIIKRDKGEIIRSAKSVIIVPGYGMALAQAQHLVRTLSDKFEENGAEVKFAIHPVAGRMPGHMNVLLAEADIPYEKLYEMDVVNEEFADTDLVIVIGANDVINPAARDAKDTPIYGMPVLNVDHAKEIFICNFDLQPGYAGVDNPLYKRKEGVYLLLGDAKESISDLINRFD